MPERVCFNMPLPEMDRRHIHRSPYRGREPILPGKNAGKTAGQNAGKAEIFSQFKNRLDNFEKMRYNIKKSFFKT